MTRIKTYFLYVFRFYHEHFSRYRTSLTCWLPKNMRYAFAYGADAVYAGQPRYSLRVRNNEFDHDNLAIGIKEAHKLGKNSMSW